MAFDVERLEEIVVIRLAGDLSPAATATLSDAVLPHIAGRPAHVILNLVRAPRIGAAGLGLIATLCRVTKTAGCALTLTNVHPRVRECLDAVALSALVDIAASESDVLEDFEMSRQVVIAV